MKIAKYKVSIIIPVLNQVNKLELCISALRSQIQEKDTIEVLVVDTGSTDGSEQLADKYNFKSIEGSGSSNPYSARNYGADLATGDILVFLDSKCLPLDNYIHEIEKLAQRDDWDVIAGDFAFIGLNGNSTFGELAYAISHLRTNPIFNGGEVSCLTGNMMVKKEVFYELGKFDAKRSGGDVKFSQLAQNRNKRKIYSSQLIVGYNAKKYTDLIESVKRDAIDLPQKMSILGVRPAGYQYIRERLQSLQIEVSGFKLIQLQFFIMYIRWVKYISQFR